MHAYPFHPHTLVESGNPSAFAALAGRWLAQREAENHLMLAHLARLQAEFQAGQKPAARFFSLQEGVSLLAALIALPDILHITWAAFEMMPPIVSGLAAANCPVSAVTGPGHVALFLARAWSAQTSQSCALQRSERVYQIARIIHAPPPNGRLAQATEGDLPIVLDWFATLARETNAPVDSAESLARQLVQDRQLFLWNQPGPVAMAAIAAATLSGVSLRHIYVPAGLRRKGHGKAIIAALASHLLSSGKHFCFLLTDPANLHADMLLQQVGARTICELAQWRITPPYTPAPAATPE